MSGADGIGRDSSMSARVACLPRGRINRENGHLPTFGRRDKPGTAGIAGTGFSSGRAGTDGKGRDSSMSAQKQDKQGKRAPTDI